MKLDEILALDSFSKTKLKVDDVKDLSLEDILKVLDKNNLSNFAQEVKVHFSNIIRQWKDDLDLIKAWIDLTWELGDISDWIKYSSEN